MRRRDFLAVTGATAALWPLRALAQQARLKRVGFIHGFASPTDPLGAANFAAFLRGLQEQGWVQARNVQVDARFTAGSRADADAFARELIGLAPDALLTLGTPATAAVLAVTRTVPTVFAIVTDPISDGFITNFARPEANITGLTTYFEGIAGKWLDLLKEIAPAVSTVGVMFNPDTAPGRGLTYLRSIEAASVARAVKVLPLVVRSDDDIRTTLANLAGQPGPGLIPTPDSFHGSRTVMLAAEVAKHRLPAVYPFTTYTESGGLISYGIEFNERIAKAGGYTGLILNGAKVADLPVQEPNKFELVVNLKTARALGLAIPPTLLIVADRVIE